MKSQHQRVDAFVHGRRRRRCFSSSWDARATARFRQSGVAHDDEHKRRLFFISGEKNSNFFFCSLSRLGFLSKKRLSQFEPRFSRRKTNSRLRKARNLTTQLTKHPSLRSERERRDVVFVFEFITVAVVCARRSAPRVLLVEDTQKQSRLRGARCRRWYVLHRKAHSLRAIFSMYREQKREERRRSRCRRRKNERILRKRVFRRARRRRRERRAEVASMGFPRVCENDFLYLSRRGEKTSKEDNLLWYRGRKKEGPPPAPEKKDLFIRSTRRGGAVYLFSERMIQ